MKIFAALLITSVFPFDDPDPNPVVNETIIVGSSPEDAKSRCRIEGLAAMNAAPPHLSFEFICILLKK